MSERGLPLLREESIILLNFIMTLSEWFGYSSAILTGIKFDVGPSV